MTDGLESKGPGNRRWKWGARAFLLAIFVQGFPIDGELGESQQMYAEEIRAKSVVTVTTLGFERSVIPLLVWGSLYLVAMGLLLRRGGKEAVTMLRRQWPVALLLLLVPMGVLWSDFKPKILSNTGHAIGSVSLALAAQMYYRNRWGLFLRHVNGVLALNLAIQMTAVIMAPSVAIVYDGRWMGLSGHPNTLGALGYGAMWAGLACLAVGERSSRFFPLLSCALGLLALYGSNSMTSQVSAGVTAGVAATVYVLNKSFTTNRLKNAAQALGLMATLGFALAAWNWQFLLGTLAPAMGRSADLTGRLALWQSAVDLIAHGGIFGWGFDGNAAIIAGTDMPYFQFHNGYLDVLVRGGIVGLSLLVLSGLMIYRHLRVSTYAAIFASATFILPLLVYNLAQTTFFEFRNLFWILYLYILFAAVPRFGSVKFA